MNERSAIKMLDRIRDEDCCSWTQEAWDSFDMAIVALKNQEKARKLRKVFLSTICGLCFFAGLVMLATVENGSRINICLAILFLAVGAVSGNACDNDRK